MAEELNIEAQTKEGKYKELIPQLEGLVYGENDLIANLANISAALKYTMNYFWVGFYIVKNDQLVLGPFQGPIACTRINKGKGVCGTSWLNNEVLVVPNVEKFPGHIACNAASKSEIVLPLRKNNEVVMILDIDSDRLNDFDDVDKLYLLQIINIIENLI